MPLPFTLSFAFVVSGRRGLEVLVKFKVVILELLYYVGKCDGLFLLWVHRVPTVIFAGNIVLDEFGGHQLIFGDVVPIVVLIPIYLDVSNKFSIRGALVSIEEVDHRIICTLTPPLQPIHVYFDILI